GDVNVGGRVVQLTAGDSHTCALLASGNVRCWGIPYFGHLGYANTHMIGDNEAPATAGDVNVGGSVVSVSAGHSHTCAVLATGNLRCWGWANEGALGYGNTNMIGDDELPYTAGNVSVGGAVVQVAAGFSHSCALLSTERVRCWGSGWRGELGYGYPVMVGENALPHTMGDVPVQ
ncbi:MAG TPA: hypothetical protein VK524_16000, partial [Polyangiaceae bacterium]|nr:hypothetical protein [Polyangiaceae bacterium]